MTQVFIDPEQVQDFASRMNAYAHDVSSQIQGIHADFIRLGETWRDAEYARFTHEMEETERNVRRYVEECEQYVQFLKSKAAAARAIQDAR